MSMNPGKNTTAGSSNHRAVATLGGGCFWCLDAAFGLLHGVEKVESGYAGGTVANPSYKEVCSGATGHAEVVQFTYDPQTLPFKQILEAFFAIHDPTTLNRQGADVGTQYRSAIFYHDHEQKVIVEQVIEELNAASIWDAPVVTEVTPFTTFYRAEDHHQQYYVQKPNVPYCRMVIAPKLAKFRQHHLVGS